MAHIGYIRVSTADQNTARQLDGIYLDKTFEEYISGAAQVRPIFQECLNYIREGDTLHLHSIDRLARNLNELQKTVSDLTGRGITVHFHAENLIFGGIASPIQTLLFQIMGAFAQFERSILKERQREGLAQAKANGQILGRPTKMSSLDRQTICEKLKQGISPHILAKEYNVSTSSIYKVGKKQEIHCNKNIANAN